MKTTQNDLFQEKKSEVSKANRSTAVMQRRKPGTKQSLDDFPTPPWATRAMLAKIINPRHRLKSMTVWEPCCNRGYMSNVLAEYFGSVRRSDVVDYGCKQFDGIYDFLCDEPAPFPSRCDWIITNPPFVLAEEIILKALTNAEVGVAVILRSAFLEGVGRYERLFKDNPPSIVAQHSERVPMVEGKYDPFASSATAYSWMIWEKHNSAAPEFLWIPQCKQTYFRDSDTQIGIAA